ncbi:Hydrolase-like protein family [Perilla frutescens var. hirtella]|uniref:Hydrolase-like protein family n=1 Tax=Perilla frutescens var. hirtella TaxID=608512 RepID=A0AAD4J9Q0_PERFH|nr:Hydrolase-like protein family [Perilla frutescens var. frutescens]KAH6793005.1 Hydrolase-like protein family [Perilla frutescens var. hirtella]KAH6829158.1 Hydrolase-like protein family [Perilla frutescens var. hirtella]
MAASPPLFYSCSPRIISRRNTNCVSHHNPTSSSSSSCSPSPYSSYSNSSCHLPGRFWNFITFSGIKVIWKHHSVKAQAMRTTQGDISSPRPMINVEDKPDHLLVLVHGIMGSPSDWTYCEAELKRRLGKKFLIYASSCNMYTKTFTGIDGAGKRLADEVMEVVKKEDGLKKISFLAHSLGGLIARYAIAVLYTPNVPSDYPHDTATNSKTSSSSNNGLIAGLEAINFITLATPHLGVRGKKQLPFLLGVPFLEKIAPPIAPIFTGQTGSQLFLTDGEASKPPLLLRMASDCDEGKFLSALGAFKYRVLYANVSYDHMVGWRTSSIRREEELVKPTDGSLDGYEHIVNLEYCPPVLSESPNFPSKAAEAKEAAQNDPSTQNTVEYHEIMEDEMIRGLQRLGWTKVDVSFHSVFWPFFAHYNIQVKNELFHNAGAGVVAHVADTIKQQDSSPYIGVSL